MCDRPGAPLSRCHAADSMACVTNDTNGSRVDDGALTETQRARLRDLLADIEPGRGGLLTALHRAQHELGWVPRDAMTVVAKQLRLSEAQVFGPASFYSEFRLTPPPRTLVAWCSGPTCRVLPP